MTSEEKNAVVSSFFPEPYVRYFIIKEVVIVWIICIHANCFGRWNNQDCIRKDMKKKTELCLFFFSFPPVVPTLRTGTLFWEMDSSMPLTPSYRYITSTLSVASALWQQTFPERVGAGALSGPIIFFSSEWMTVSLLSALLLAFFAEQGTLGEFHFFFFLHWTACLFLLRG